MGVDETLALLQGRWKILILFHLLERPTTRFSQLGRAIPKISERMLVRQLRDLERDGLVERTAFPEVPPRVEYSLTEKGGALRPAFDELVSWASKDRNPNIE